MTAWFWVVAIVVILIWLCLGTFIVVVFVCRARRKKAGTGGEVFTYKESAAAIHKNGNTVEWFVTPDILRQVADYLEDEWKKPGPNVPGWIFRSMGIDLHVHYDQFGGEDFIQILKNAIGLNSKEARSD